MKSLSSVQCGSNPRKDRVVKVAKKVSNFSEVMDAMASVPQEENRNEGEDCEMMEQVMTRSKRALENGGCEVVAEKICNNDEANLKAANGRQEMKKRRFNEEPLMYSVEHKASLVIRIDDLVLWMGFPVYFAALHI
ncbi:uncharacterized protein [Musca autumnalis]|uniref:uncharacterized protein n=1 Tax=Musca autumnalis TaxID=221902 RepID=UPI003CEF0C57